MGATRPAAEVWAEVRQRLLDERTLVRAVASGPRRGNQPPWRRVEVRYVDLSRGRHLQVTGYDDRQAHTANHRAGSASAAEVDRLLAEPYGNWHLETLTETVQVRVTKRGDAVLHRRRRQTVPEPVRGHDRLKQRLLPADDPVLVGLGISDAAGTVKPSRQAKLRQVEEFLRLLDATLTEALAAGHLRRPTEQQPLRSWTSDAGTPTSRSPPIGS